MILRRLVQSLRRQDWPTVLLEVMIVVLGVFLGIEVANWNEDRQNRDLAATYIDRLHADVARERALWERAIDYFDTARHYADSAIEGFRAPPETLDAQWLVALYQASQVWYIYPNRSTFDELQATGRIVNISDPELRTILANHYQGPAQTSFSLLQNSPYRRIARLYLHESVQAEIRDQCSDQWVSEAQNFYYVTLPESCALDLPEALIREEILNMHGRASVQEELRFHQSVLGAQVGVMKYGIETATTTLLALEAAK